MLGHSPSLSSCLGVFFLLVLTEAVYLRPSILRGDEVLLGMDYLHLHIRRIAFARNALFGARHMLPGWNPQELLGMPFSANLQSFPWIPTRFALFLFDPAFAYAAGVAIAAALAAVFTYNFCRRSGLSVAGAAAAGWTFACAGFFTSRVAAGHLPLLEAYPALPLLLWLIGRALSPERANRRAFDLGVLAAGAACIALAGHPQIPVYAVGVAVLYAIVRGRGWLRVKIVSAIALGLGATMAAWWPMLSLIRRSTRILALAPPDNDVTMPYHRLLAFVAPGVDGWPPGSVLSSQQPFHGYTYAYFWDTTWYLGLLPPLAAIALLVWCIGNRRLPGWPWVFLAVVGLGALLFALPLSDPFRRAVPGTFLRSPARLLYVTTFSISVVFGAGVDALMNTLGPRLRQVAVAVCLALHFLDLGGFSLLLIQHFPPAQSRIPELEPILARETGIARVAMDGDDIVPGASSYDDVGGFDSILLASSYRALLALTQSPPDLNVQSFKGASLPIPALRAAGVRFVLTETERTDLELAGSAAGTFLYRVPDPAPRAAYFTAAATGFFPRGEVLDAFVAQQRWDRLMLPVEAKRYLPPARSASNGNGEENRKTIAYSRSSSDEILLQTGNAEPGFVHVLESHDPGWSAEVDGVPAPIVLANGFSMAVPVPSGSHAVRLRYRTPGRLFGAILSLLSLCGLAALLFRSRSPRPNLD